MNEAVVFNNGDRYLVGTKLQKILFSPVLVNAVDR